MKILAFILVLAYAALNAFLAVSVLVIERQSSLAAKAVPCLGFAAAAALLTAGALTRGPWLVVVGLTLGSLAPIIYGILVEHSNVMLHHVVRGAIAAVIGVVFWIGVGNQ